MSKRKPDTPPAPAATPATPAPNPIVQAIELQSQGRIAEAESLFRRILEVAPTEPLSLYSLGVILLNRGDRDEALQIFRRGAESPSAIANNWVGYASALQAVGQREEALAAYEQALAMKPDYVEALVNCGVLLRDLHRHKDALMRFTEALNVAPDHTPAIANAAILLTEFKESERAIAMFGRLLALKPDYDFGLGLLIFERLHSGDWTDFDLLRDKIVAGIRRGERTCKTLAFMALSDSAADHFLCARIFAKQYCMPAQEPLWRGERYRHQRLRIAYVSPDLREHPVGHLMCGVFEQHDKSRFETIGISLCANDGSRLRQRMLKAFDHFIDAELMETRDIAKLMRDMEIDIAIDLAGYTSDSRTGVFAYRPAPIHMNYLGYCGTLGVEYMDYILADRNVIPERHQPFYQEKVVYMPNQYMPTDASIAIADETPTREACGLPPEGAVFCSFSHDYKITPPLWRVWMSLLTKAPGSVLWLVSRNQGTIEHYRQAAEAHGISRDRLIFATRVPRVEDHLARYRLADVFLDTSPYNAHTTTADALFSGCPVVTCMGDSFASRVAGSLIQAAGMPELVANNWEEYEALALRLATDKEWNRSIRQKLQQQKAGAPLFDTTRFVRDLEGVFTKLAKDHGLAP